MSSVGNFCSCAENTTVFASLLAARMMPKYQLAFLKLRQLQQHTAQLWQTNSIVHPSVGLSVAHRLERYRLLQTPARAAPSWLQPGS